MAIPTSRIIIIFVLLAIGAQLPDTLRPYRPGVDEGFMLQAVSRSLQEQGFNAGINDSLIDLATPEYYHLYQWPPGFCFVVLLLAKLGLSLPLAAKTIDLIAIVMGNLGWLLLAKMYLKKTPFVLFATLLLCVFRGSQAGATDLIFWALMPYWLWTIQMAIQNTETKIHSHWLWVAAIIASVSVIFRFAAGYLMIAGGLIGLLLMSGPLLHRIIKAAILSLPPFATTLTIFAWNGSHTKSASYLSKADMGWTLDRLSIYYPSQAFFAEFGGIKLAVMRAFSTIYAPTWAWVALIIFALFLCLLVYQNRAHLTDKNQKLHVATMVLCWLSLVFFLSIVTGRFSDTEFGNWTYLEEPRFYNHQLPAFAIMWFVLLQNIPYSQWHSLNKKGLHYAGLCLLLGAWIYDFQGFVRGSLGEGARTPTIQTEVREYVDSHLKEKKIANYRIFDMEVDYLIWDNAFVATRFAPEAQLSSSQNTDSIYVMVIHRAHLYENLPVYDPMKYPKLPPYLLHRNPALPRLYIEKLKLSLQKEIPYSQTKIYSNWVSPYAKGALDN